MFENTINIRLKTSLEVHRIRKPSRIIEQLFQELREIIKPGITTKGIDSFCDEYFKRHHVVSAQKGYRGFPASVCVSPNQVAAHGIPNNYPLGRGDIFTVDVTIYMDGWHSDAAWTFIVGPPRPEALYLIKSAWQATRAGVMAARAGNRLGDIGAAIQKIAAHFGCAVLDDFAGHGIGESFHEDPIVANTGTNGVGQPIVPGMVFTVEPILSLGGSRVKTLEDGWTVVTCDNCLTAQFEHTVAVFGDRTEVLTFSERNLESCPEEPPFY
ncbi:MAG: type I methionyl aminopeptidase [Spirochaetales bacterium]|nr:type I methionyl aminopeptidase [Spirochaetales bacterium]